MEYARNQSALGLIDNVANISSGRHQLYFYRGTHDTCYKTGSQEATVMFYARLTGDTGEFNCVSYEGSVPSNHAQASTSISFNIGRTKSSLAR